MQKKEFTPTVSESEMLFRFPEAKRRGKTTSRTILVSKGSKMMFSPDVRSEIAGFTHVELTIVADTRERYLKFTSEGRKGMGVEINYSRPDKPSVLCKTLVDMIGTKDMKQYHVGLTEDLSTNPDKCRIYRVLNVVTDAEDESGR